jgi:hypothetical protein
MEHGLILSLMGMGAGFLFGVSGLWLLTKHRSSPSVTKIQIPFIGEIQTDAPAIAVVFIGALLIAYPVYTLSGENVLPQEKTHFHGTITKEGLSSQEGILVWVIPDGYQAMTDSAGHYTVDVPLPKYGSYTAVAYYKTPETREVYVSGYPIGEEVVFDHTFKR